MPEAFEFLHGGRLAARGEGGENHSITFPSDDILQTRYIEKVSIRETVGARAFSSAEFHEAMVISR